MRWRIWRYIKRHFVSLLAYVGGLYLFVYAESKILSPDATIQDMATVIGSGAAVISVGYIAQQIKESVAQQKVNISKNFVLKFLSDDLSEARKIIRTSFEAKNMTPEQVLAEIDADPNKEKHISALCNFFECLGVFYNENRLDKTMIRECFTAYSINVYDKTKKFIDKVKNEFDPLKAPTIYVNWVVMNMDMERMSYLLRKDYRDSEN
jgi:hypothetical protein